MATNPPFQVEDQTDEDFFDNLVNDDDDDSYKAGGSNLGSSNLVDGSDSDEVRAFANLSVSDVGTGMEDSVGVAEKMVKSDGGLGRANVASSSISAFDAMHSSNEIVSSDVKSGISGEDNNGIMTSDVASGSFGTDNSNMVSGSLGADRNGVVRSDVALESVGGKSHGGVKEVQWSAFTADPAGSFGNGFGSDSDFFTGVGDNSADPFGAADNLISESNVTALGSVVGSSADVIGANDFSHHVQEINNNGVQTQTSIDGQDSNNLQYWESLYPGWKYDANTRQWYQVDASYDASSNVQVQGHHGSNSAADWAVSEEKSEVSYLQQTAQSMKGSVLEKGTTESVTSWNPDSQSGYSNGSLASWNQASQERGTAESVGTWNSNSQAGYDGGSFSNSNQASQENSGYPSHMYFDPQYPGWYYDMIAQDWRSLDAYHSQQTVAAQNQQNHYEFPSSATTYEPEQKNYGEQGQVVNYGSVGLSRHEQNLNSSGTFGYSMQQGSNMWQPAQLNQQVPSYYGSNVLVDKNTSQRISDDSGVPSTFDNTTHARDEFSSVSQSQGFFPAGNLTSAFDQPRIEQKELMHVSNNYFSNQNSLNYSQQPVQTQQQSYTPAAGRSSAGRPPHALVTFGFGGKLIFMKDATLLNTSYGSQETKGGSLSVLNLADVVNGGVAASNSKAGDDGYIRALQSFPGPLTGGNVGNKEVNKWIDERIAQCQSPDVDYRKGEVLRLLLSLLKIAFQHYGKFRSPFGTDTASKETDAPELAVAKLFASAKRNGAQFPDYGSLSLCLQQLPSEGQIRATASEVQTLLVSGRKIEALQCAQQGQLWGPALVLAAQLGEQFYVETVRQMALRQLVAGSPLRTLCLLIAGQPADVFSSGSIADGGNDGVNQQPSQIPLGANCMLDEWEENLAVITANRTKDDGLVLIHLGDCLYKEKSDIIAAHICYLVAEANFETYSDSARMCLIGADHWNNPRTYASPEAIQRTEVYEYSKLLGNSQFTLLPFQPYKLIYAHMLAEVGRVSDSLRYCQAVAKSLKTGRAPEVETWRQLVTSLEDRIKAHQQGGFSTNLAPGKLVGRLLNLFDSTAHRVVGGLPPPVPSGGGTLIDHHQSSGARVTNSQSTMAMSSLVPSASMEPISEFTADSNRKSMHNRSVSEPDFGRSPRQAGVDSSNKGNSADPQSKAAGVTSRFGRFGFGSQLLQKTVGLVLKPRQDKQAKLGDSNKFYYDEKLKRWVEEGAEPPAEEAALPPPPTSAVFQNGTSDYNVKSALRGEVSPGNGSPEFTSPTSVGHSSGIPPIPTVSNQFSARGRVGVRARYVDTFNKGGGNPANLFHSPSTPSIKPATGTNPKIFVPAPMPSAEQPEESSPDSTQSTIEYPSAPSSNDSYQPPGTMQRFGSMENVRYGTPVNNTNGPLPPHSRRTASWSGSFVDGLSPPPSKSEVKPLGEVLGISPSAFMPSEPSFPHSLANGGSFAEDLHEVEL